MAFQQGIASVQIQDATGEVTSFDQPFKFDDAVASLANILSFLTGLAAQVDVVTEGKITKLRLSILVPLPGGLKASAVANSDNERTGLYTFNVLGSANAYGVDVPAFPVADFIGNQILLSSAGSTSFTAYLENALLPGGVAATDRYGNPFVSVKHAVKTFRKHRRALRRA